MLVGSSPKQLHPDSMTSPFRSRSLLSPPPRSSPVNFSTFDFKTLPGAGDRFEKSSMRGLALGASCTLVQSRVNLPSALNSIPSDPSTPPIAPGLREIAFPRQVVADLCADYQNLMKIPRVSFSLWIQMSPRFPCRAARLLFPPLVSPFSSLSSSSSSSRQIPSRDGNARIRDEAKFDELARLILRAVSSDIL
mgnify:CR=1 FL=1